MLEAIRILEEYQAEIRAKLLNNNKGDYYLGMLSAITIAIKRLEFNKHEFEGLESIGPFEEVA